MSLDEFLAWEREQPEKYEYAGGVIKMMTGASIAHASARNSTTSRRLRSGNTRLSSRTSASSISTRARVEGWIDEIVEGDAVLKLSSIGVEVSLDVIYEDIDLAATRPREGERRIPAE
jgi:hypothetical protein